MSLYEQYFSDINKKFMYDMLCNIFIQENNINIESEENYKKYIDTMEGIFNDRDYEDISDINKELLDHNLRIFRDEYVNKDAFSIQESLEEVMKKRDEEVNNVRVMNDKLESSSNVQDILLKNTVSTNISDIIDIGKNDKDDKDDKGDKDYKDDIGELIDDIDQRDKIKTEEIIKKESYIINSSNRMNTNSSRYNYQIELSKEGIDSRKIRGISRLIIPIEDNYIFSIPILKINIKEIDLSIYLQQKELIKNKFNSVAIYEPIEDHSIEEVDTDRLTIDIRDISGIEYKSYDILKINILEVKDDIVIFTCSNIDKSNYRVNDIIRILNNHTNSFDIILLNLLVKPMKIKAIRDNMIFCRLSTKYGEYLFNDIDMKILNISNQHLLYINQSS